MTINSINMKSLMPKTQQLSKIQQIENNKQKNFLYIQNNNQEKTIEKNLKKVNNSEKTSKTKITKDNNKDKNNKDQNNNGNDDSNVHRGKEVDRNDLPDVLGTNIDIKI